MNTIYKYPLAVLDEQEVSMPGSAVVLCVQIQAGHGPCLWARVNTEFSLEKRTFLIVGTGNPFPESKRPPVYIGTVQQGPFVWHVFEKV